ncbi:MAG: ChbG/HpnK family deacetylase [Elusimicrobia bacterium]|nr:ChbG/HpnK family deacetylase [Elusimicrobiota bacterium]
MTADDFGLARGINRGIMDCVERGIVTSVSLCVNGSEYEEALVFCRRFPGLDAGLHILLVEGDVLSSASAESGLSDGEGRLPGNWAAFLPRYFLRGIKPGGLEKEIGAQFDKICGSGIRVVHVNSHQHLHILPGILEIVIDNCRKYGIKYIRVPYSRPGLHWLSAGIRRVFWQAILNLFCARALPKIRAAGLLACGETTGVLHAGSINIPVLKQIIISLQEGLSEIICHPARAGRELFLLYGHWGYSWDQEADSMCSGEARELLQDNGITLCSFSAAERENEG